MADAHISRRRSSAAADGRASRPIWRRGVPPHCASRSPTWLARLCKPAILPTETSHLQDFALAQSAIAVCTAAWKRQA